MTTLNPNAASRRTLQRVTPDWRRAELADLWRCSERKIDRMADDGRLGPPDKFIGRTPLWTDATRRAAEQRMTEAAAERRASASFRRR